MQTNPTNLSSPEKQESRNVRMTWSLTFQSIKDLNFES